MKANKFSHVDEKGKAKMVDVGSKPDSKRIAVAKGSISLAEETIELIKANQMKKGDVLAVAKIAGIQAAKETPRLVPLCHPLLLTNIELDCEIFHNRIEVASRVESAGKTGVEMEALTAVSVALLTVYDMCKAVDKNMRIGEVRLWEKSKQPV
jgi:cyclic pyranopterin phosphate synthase